MDFTLLALDGVENGRNELFSIAQLHCPTSSSVALKPRLFPSFRVFVSVRAHFSGQIVDVGLEHVDSVVPSLLAQSCFFRPASFLHYFYEWIDEIEIVAVYPSLRFLVFLSDLDEIADAPVHPFFVDVQQLK